MLRSSSSMKWEATSDDFYEEHPERDSYSDTKEGKYAA